MSLNFRARAKHSGKCALAGCVMDGNKIYEGEGLRILACTQGHAEAALKRVNEAVTKAGASQEQRDMALRLFNEQERREELTDDALGL